jgi:hypothetical protein
MVIKPHRNQLATTLLVTLLILLSLMSSSSSARPLNGISQLAEASNIALPSEKEGHMSVVWGRGGGKSYGTLILIPQHAS